MSTPRVDTVSASYYRKGKCEVCNKQAERERTFQSASFVGCEQQAKAWMAKPIRHKRCEWL